VGRGTGTADRGWFCTSLWSVGQTNRCYHGAIEYQLPVAEMPCGQNRQDYTSTFFSFQILLLPKRF